MAGSFNPTDDLEKRLHSHVDRLAGLIGPRHTGRDGSMDAAAALIEREFTAMGYSVERQTYDADGHLVSNLVIERRGLRRADEIIILGAHYDTVPETPGADDNASAVAVLIETARLLCDRNFQRTVRFVAFACEEPPHFYTDTMGSQVYAAQCGRRDENIVGMLCLEMVGYFTNEPDSQAIPREMPRVFRFAFPTRGNFLAAVGNLRSVRLGWTFRRGFKKAVRFPLYSISLPESIHSIRLSDNGSFWDQAYPALMLTDTSFLRNPHYHQSTDTVGTLNYSSMAQVTRGVAEGLSRLARPG